MIPKGRETNKMGLFITQAFSLKAWHRRGETKQNKTGSTIEESDLGVHGDWGSLTMWGRVLERKWLGREKERKKSRVGDRILRDAWSFAFSWNFATGQKLRDLKVEQTQSSRKAGRHFCFNQIQWRDLWQMPPPQTQTYNSQINSWKWRKEIWKKIVKDMFLSFWTS